MHVCLYLAEHSEKYADSRRPLTAPAADCSERQDGSRLSSTGPREAQSGQHPAQALSNQLATPAFAPYSHRMATEDENPIQPDVTAMLKGQTSACKAARDAIAAGGEVVIYDGQPPVWMVLGIAATRLRRSLKIGLTTLGLDETVEILRARHRDEQLRTGNIVAADRAWLFTLYFNATGTELLACSGLNREAPSKTGGQKLQL